MREFILNGSCAAFTDSGGGTADSAYGTNNLAVNVGDDPKSVVANRDRLEEWAGVPIIWMNQTHSNHVAVVESAQSAVTVNADAVIVSSGLAAAVMTADCIPVLVSSDIGIGAAIHAGRRGIESNIISHTMRRMLGLGATRFWTAIGPRICGKHYEVDQLTYDSVCQTWPMAASQSEQGTPSLELANVARAQLSQFDQTLVLDDERCTYSDCSLFSYRRSSITGRQAGVIVPV